MRSTRFIWLLTTASIVATACGGTYHPESPDVAALVEVEGGASGQDQTSPDTGSTTGPTPDGTASPSTGGSAGPSTTGGSSTGTTTGTTGTTTGSPDTSTTEDQAGDPTETATEAASTPPASTGANGYPVADVGAERPANASGKILLGIVGPHTGPIALQGLASLRGVQAVIADYNARGGIQGVPIELLVEDDQFDPAQGRRYVQQMINEDQIFAMMGLVTPATFAQSLPDFEASGTLQMIGDGAASTGGSRLVFPSYQKCPTSMGAAGEYAVSHLGYTKVAIMEIDIEVSRSCANAIVETVEELGAQIASRVAVTPGGIGCDSQAQSTTDSGAETVLIQAETLTMIRCVQALKQAGFTGQIGLSANAIDDDALVDALGDDAEGIYGASGFYPKTHPTTKAVCTDVIDTYYPDSGATQYLGYASCIGTRILLDALNVLGPDATAREVIGYLEATPYDSMGMATAPLVWDPATDHEPYRAMMGIELRDGVWIPTTDPFDPVWGR